MDLDVKAPPKDDEEIIDLTDIIEKGPQAKADPAALNEDIDNLVSDLGNTSNLDIPSDAEADIDALLAQMDAGVDITAAPSPSAPQTPSEDPDADFSSVSAEDDLPDTSDVDALLESMDMPPQPDPVKASPADTATNDSAADMDALLESILDGPPAKSPKAEAAPVAEKSPSPPADDLADLDAMLDDITSKPAPAAPAAEKAPSPPADDLADLDAMLEDITGESKPVEEQAPSAQADDLADLDAMLNDIVSDTKEAPKAEELSKVQPEESESSSPADSEDILNDLDELLRSVDDEDKVQMAGSHAQDDLDLADVDKVLDEVGLDAPVQADDIAESLLPGAKGAKTSESLAGNIMDAVDAMSDKLDFIPDNIDELSDNLTSCTDDDLDIKTDLDDQLSAEVDALLGEEPALESEDELNKVLKPEPTPEPTLEKTPEEDLMPEPEAGLGAEPEVDMADELLVADPVVMPVSAPTLETVHTAGSRVEAMESLNKVQEEQEDLVKRVVYLEERVVQLEDLVASLEQKLVQDLESMAAKAAAKIIREEIAALLADE